MSWPQGHPENFMIFSEDKTHKFAMEEAVRVLVDTENHRAILDLEGECYRPLKTIAAIQLGEYETALLYAEKHSFEAAYALYKLFKYRRALRVLNRLDGRPSLLLKAQCLYFLGYYAAAHKIFSEISTENEFAVNLAAIESLDYLNAKNRDRPSKYATEYRDRVESPVTPDITGRELQLEYEYNLLFRLIEDEGEFVRSLRALDEKHGYIDGCVARQLKNLYSEFIAELGRRESETVEFNTGKRTSLSDPVHFQKNFVAGTKSEYKVFAEYMKPGNESNYDKIDSSSDKKRLLKVYLALKAGAKRRVSSRKLLEKCHGSPIKEALLLLLEDTKNTDGFEQRALSVLRELKGQKTDNTVQAG